MKKFVILLGILIFSVISQSKLLNEDATHIYCIGIGAPTKLKDGGISFKASLCRVREKVLRNVTVVHIDWAIDENYNVREKLIYEINWHAYIDYDDKKGKITVNQWIPSKIHSDSGFISPISNSFYGMIVDKDLIEVYGNTLNVPTVSEEYYINNFN